MAALTIHDWMIVRDSPPEPPPAPPSAQDLSIPDEGHGVPALPVDAPSAPPPGAPY